jgi:probable HAF family extracellular repeat protein
MVSAEILYDLTNLGSIGEYGDVESINNNGEIVGSTGNSDPEATLFDATGGGNHIFLGSLTGDDSRAYSINDSGQIVGWGRDASNKKQTATLFDPTGNGNNINLGMLPGASWSTACSINNSGQIVGYAGNATLFDASGGGNNVDLGTLSGQSSCANAINDYGQIVGWSASDSSDRNAFLYENGTMTDLGTLGGAISSAYSINNSGRIVGWATDNINPGYNLATLFDASGGGNNVYLGGLGGNQSLAVSINNNGQIVGWAQNESGGYRATLFDPTGNGNNIDLNDLIDPGVSLTLTRAYCINDNGWIVGTAGEYGWLLIPIPQPLLQILTVDVEPNDIGIDTIDPNVGDNSYYTNSTVNLKATRFIDCPDVYQFDYWVGDVNDVNDPNTTVFMDSDKTVTAYFMATRECGDECHPNDLFGDYNHDCIIDFNDFAWFANNWLVCTKPECD